jgi:LysM repeat protein
MRTERESQRDWRINILLTAGVLVTLLLGFILAQLDALQARVVLDVPGLPVINIQATAIAVGRIIPLNANPESPVSIDDPFAPVPDDLNPRPEFITGVSEEGVIFTVCGEVPEGWLLYTVRPGETLASLAAGTETAAAELAAANCLTEGQLTAGMQLLVPREPVLSLCGPPQWWARYQVQPGDTIDALARNRGTTVDEILRANCRDSLELVAGQLIFLPPGAQSGGAPSLPQPSLTPLPPPTAIPTLAPIPTATTVPPSPFPTVPVVPTPSPTIPPPPPTATPPLPPTDPPPTATEPPPALPTDPPPPPTNTPPLPTEPPPAPTDPPPTEPPPTDPPPAPTDTPPATELPEPTESPPTEPPP